LVSCIGLASCTTTARQVEIRPIDPSAVLSRGGDEVAVARGQLALGNVGLALEGFRKAQRSAPTDTRPLAGLGDCYASMGRFDLAQSNYEAALALAPHDRGLLLGLAAIFEREGDQERAAIARADANRPRQAPPGPMMQAGASAPRQPAPDQAGAIQAAAVPIHLATGSITVELPPARPADHLQGQPIVAAATPIELAAAPLVERPSVALDPVRTLAAARPVQASRSVPQPPVVEAVQPVHFATGSITVELPPARPALRLEAQASMPALPPFQLASDPAQSATVPLPPTRPAPRPPILPKPELQPVVAGATGPRLERLSRGEVALVTTDKPIWRAQGETRTTIAAGVRWVALAPPRIAPNVQVLNAAQTRGVAASARAVLLDRGWRRIAIGNAADVQEKSVVLYSKDRARLGRSLAAQFGVASRMVDRDGLVLVIGRDAADRIPGQQRS
jgi:hypothetical protein